MKLTPSNWKDISRYYYNTYVKFKEHGDQLFYIQNVTAEAVTGVYNGGEDSFVVNLYEDSPYELNYILPHKSVFQYRDKALLLYRVPARQYFRGLCSDNTRILDVVRNNHVDFTWPVLRSYVEKQAFFTLKEAINAKKYTSMALNSRMLFNRQNTCIYVDHRSIATVVDGGKKIVVNKAFKNDVETLVAQDPFTTEIVCE